MRFIWKLTIGTPKSSKIYLEHTFSWECKLESPFTSVPATFKELHDDGQNAKELEDITERKNLRESSTRL